MGWLVFICAALGILFILISNEYGAMQFEKAFNLKKSLFHRFYDFIWRK